jgi:hypothetical protein
MSEKSSSAIPVLLSPKEAAEKYRCSVSFLAKKRMTGDGPVSSSAVAACSTRSLCWCSGSRAGPGRRPASFACCSRS